MSSAEGGGMEIIMNKEKAIIMAVILVLGIIGLIFLSTPAGIKTINTYLFNMQKTDDVTDYNTIKEVEDTCRAMISSYESDKLTYEQYKDADSEEKQDWAEQAKMRANKTAVSYNNYILKNSFVWKDNVPDDVCRQLEIIE